MVAKSRERRPNAAQVQPDTYTCVHHWQIEPADGPVSEGYCLDCGKEGQFQNYVPDDVKLNRVGGRSIRIGSAGRAG